jgi:tetratricopeptide (TPR) repeat protein
MRFQVEKFRYPENIIGDAPLTFFAKLLLLFLWIAVARGFGQEERTDEFAQLVAEARQAQATANYAEAAAVYKKAVKLRSDIPELWANLGLMQNAVGSYREAIASFREAVRLKPALYVPNLFLGIDYTHIQQGQEAIPFLIKAETITPSDPQAPLSLGRAYLSVGNFAGARSAFALAATLDAKNNSAWFGYGVAALDEVEVNGRKLSSEGANSAWAKALFAESLADQSRWKEAVAQQQAVLAADPRFPCGHAQLGFFYLAQQEDAAASREFAGEAPGCALATLGRTRLLLNAGDYAGALALLTTLWEHDAGFVRTHTALLSEGSTPEHASAFSAFLEQQRGGGTAVDPDLSAWLSAAFRGVPGRAQEVQPLESIAANSNAETDERDDRYGRCAAKLANSLGERSNRELLLLATCAFMTGDYGLSARASDLLESRSPHELAALYWSVKANEKLAFAAFDRFEELKPDAERTHLLLGDMYRQRKRFDQAESEYKTAAKLSPQDAAPLFGLASVYSQNSETDRALSTAKAGLHITPNDPDLNLLIGEILVSRHEWDEGTFPE